MITEFPLIYFATLVLLSVLLSVGFSCLSLVQRPFVRVSQHVSLNFSSNKWPLVLFGFLFYCFLPLDSVQDYIAYAEYYVARQQGLAGEAYGHFSKDPAFFKYVEIFSSGGIGYRLAYGVIVAFYVFSLCRLAERHRINVWMVFLFALAFGNLYFVVSGLRQAAAVSFILLAYGFYVEGRRFLAASFVVLASGFHASAFLAAFVLVFCVWLLRYKTLKLTLISLCFLSFPLLLGQIQGYSLINTVLPNLGFLIPEAFSGYVAKIRDFELNDTDLGVGFVFFTIAKVYFLIGVSLLQFKYGESRKNNLIIIIGLFYVFCFNVFGLNQFTLRFLNYLSPFLFLAMSMVLVKLSVKNSVFKLISVIFVVMSGLLSIAVSVR